jgi:NADH-quinone oxidoreductase subunit N
VNLHDRIHYLVTDIGPSLHAVWPELTLTAAIVMILLARMVFPPRKAPGLPCWITILAALAALAILGFDTYFWSQPGPGTRWGIMPGPRPIFTGMLMLDSFAIYLRGLLMLFLVLFATFTRISGVPNDDDAAEFYVMILGATIGLCVMVSANHALMVFLGIEMASVPSYVLAGILRHRRTSSEAALKYAVFGAAAAGVMLYGLSLLTGILGSAHLPTMAERLADWIREPNSARHQATAVALVLGGLMTMVGLAFKLSAVPFHFWAPDVFEGAPAEVGTFLSIASKAAAVGLLTRLALIFSGALEPFPRAADTVLALAPVRLYLAALIALLAAVTCTFGNLAAYGQTNIKRLLAYSTIAHAGYLMMPVAAAVVLVGDLSNRDRTSDAVAALFVYLGVYLFMNFGAFAIVAFVRNARGSESIADYAGMVHRSPAAAVSMAVILFSLVGLPPLAGFTAKFAAFAALLDARLYALLVIGGLNTAVSLFYYLRVVKVMMLDEEPADRPAASIPVFSFPGVFALVLAGAMFLMFLQWGGLWTMGKVAGRALVTLPQVEGVRSSEGR